MLVSYKKWTNLRTALANDFYYQQVTGNPYYPRSASESGFWNWIASNPTAVQNDTTMKQILRDINTIHVDLDPLPGMDIACGCATPDPRQTEIDANPSFPPYRTETFRSTSSSTDPTCDIQPRSCDPTTQSFNGTASYKYR